MVNSKFREKYSFNKQLERVWGRYYEGAEIGQERKRKTLFGGPR